MRLRVTMGRYMYQGTFGFQRARMTLGSVLLALILFALFLFPTGAGAQGFLVNMRVQLENALAPEAVSYILQQYGGAVTLPPQQQARVDKVFSDIVRVTDNLGLNYTLRIVDSFEINAFVTYGGNVFVTTGLLGIVIDDPDMLAGVLAHEVAHAERGHLVNKLLRRYGMELLIQIAFSDSNSDLLDLLGLLGIDLMQYQWSREEEHESDEVGIRLAAYAGYDPAGLLRFFELLRFLEGEEPVFDLWLTHPLTSDRITRVSALVEELRKGDHITSGVEELIEQYRASTSLMDQVNAWNGLRDMGSRAVPRVAEIILDDEWARNCRFPRGATVDCRREMINLLGELGAEAFAALPELARLVGRLDQENRAAAMQAIDNITGAVAGQVTAETALPTLVALAADVSLPEEVRQALVRAIYAIEPTALIGVVRLAALNESNSTPDSSMYSGVQGDLQTGKLGLYDPDDYAPFAFVLDEWLGDESDIIPTLNRERQAAGIYGPDPVYFPKRNMVLVPDGRYFFELGDREYATHINDSHTWTFVDPVTQEVSAWRHDIDSSRMVPWEGWTEMMWFPWVKPERRYFGGIIHEVSVTEEGDSTWVEYAHFGPGGYYWFRYDEYGILRYALVSVKIGRHYDGRPIHIAYSVSVPAVLPVQLPNLQHACGPAVPNERRRFEYKNYSNMPLDLSGWSFVNLGNGSSMVLPEGTVLNPGDTLVVGTTDYWNRMPRSASNEVRLWWDYLGTWCAHTEGPVKIVGPDGHDYALMK